MKENLNKILQSLRSEQSRLETEKQGLYEQSRALSRNRQSAARRCVQTLLPNLNPDSIKALRREVPGFHIPMVSTWCGLFKKIDPKVTIDTLRIQLGTYLDNSAAVPETWKKNVGLLDRSVRDLQRNEICAKEENIVDIKLRIKRIEKLSSVNLREMDPKVRRKLERALAAQAKSSRPPARLLNPVRADRAVPAYQEDSGPGLLEMWLWYQLLTSGSEISHEIDRFSGGGGNSGGGGADGGWQEKASDPAPTVTTTDSVDTHIALGAGSFS